MKMIDAVEIAYNNGYKKALSDALNLLPNNSEAQAIINQLLQRYSN